MHPGRIRGNVPEFGRSFAATITANGLAEHISTGQFDALKLVFTAQFTTPFQTMLANFAKAGSLSSTESGPLQPQRFPNLPRFSRLPALQELMMETAVRAGKYEVAFEQIKLLLTAQPNSAGLHAKLGDLYRMTGDRANAIAQLEQAGKLAPNHPDVNLMLANLLADTGGNLSEGIKDAQRALLKDPENPQIKDTIGWLYARMNYTDAALSILANLTKRYPDSPTYRYHLGYAMLQKGERQQARNELTIALSSGPAKEEDSAIRKLLASASR